MKSNLEELKKATIIMADTFEEIKLNPMDLNLTMVHIAHMSEVLDKLVDAVIELNDKD